MKVEDGTIEVTTELCWALLQHSELDVSKVANTEEFAYVLYLLIYKKRKQGNMV